MSGLKSFVDRIESVNEQIKSFNEDKRDIFAEAKSAGFDVPALKVVIQRRAKDPGKLSELESLVEAYERALGTPVALARVQARDALDIPPELDRRRAPVSA